MQKILSIVPAVVLGFSLAAPAQAAGLAPVVTCGQSTSHAFLGLDCLRPQGQTERRVVILGEIQKRQRGYVYDMFGRRWVLSGWSKWQTVGSAV